MRRSAAMLPAVSLLLLAAGCTPPAKDTHLQELSDARGQIAALQDTNRGLQDVVVAQQKQIQTLEALGPKRIEKLPRVQRIELGRYTGGVDLDGREGNDAIKVYLQPIDQQSSIIKAAGEVTVELFDLALAPEKNRIGRYQWDVDEVAKHWTGSALAYHYGFECPWQGGLPRNPEITVRVTFVDYLTGKTFTAQKLCKVSLPPATQPTQPVK